MSFEMFDVINPGFGPVAKDFALPISRHHGAGSRYCTTRRACALPPQGSRGTEMNCSSEEPDGSAAGTESRDRPAAARPGFLRRLRRRVPALRTAAAGLVLAAAALALPTLAQAQTTVWSGTLTVKSSRALLGCSNIYFPNHCSDLLTDDDFTYDGTNYSITLIFLRPSGRLEINLDTTLTTSMQQTLTLNVDGTSFAFTDSVGGTATLAWNNSGLSWAIDDTVALTLTAAAPSAQTDTTFISNSAQVGTSRSNSVYATAFTTGGNSGGYGLSSVDVYLADFNYSGTVTPRVEIFEDNAVNPGTLHATLINPATVIDGSANTFNAPPNTTLSANTIYWLAVSNSAGANGQGVRVRTTRNVTADPGAAAGWSIAGNARFKSDVTAPSWRSTINRLIFTIKGTAAGAATNTAPTAANNTVTTAEDTDYTFSSADFDFTDTDAGDSLASVKIVTLPASGTLTLSGTTIGSGALPQTVTAAQLGNLKYSPPANLYGTGVASFTFKVNDGTVDSDNAYTMNIDVKGQNDPATGKPGITGTAQVGERLTATAGTIADLDGLPNPFISATTTVVQWIQVDGATVTDISGATSETYTLATADEGKKIKVKVSFEDDDGTAEGPLTSDAYPSSGTVTAAPVTNNAPTAANNTVTTAEDRPYTFEADDFGFADADTGATLASVKIVTLPALGTLALNGTAVSLNDVVPSTDIGGLTFTPAPGGSGGDYASFMFKVNDGTDFSASANTITFNVTPANTAPTAANNTVTTTEDTDYTFSSADFDFTDTDGGDSLASVKIVTLPASGTLTLSGTAIGSGALPQTVTAAQLGNLKYSPPANLYGTGVASFTFKVNDGTVDSDNAYTMNIDVKGQNDPATGKPGITGTAQVGERLTATAGTIADLDGLPDPFISAAATTVQWIQVDGANVTDISGATSETYTLATADEGKKIKVKVSFEDDDGTAEGPLTSDAYPSSGTVTAAPVTNNAPTAANNTVTTAEDRPYTFEADDFGFADADTGAMLASVKIVTLPVLGTLALNGTPVSLNDVVPSTDIGGLTFTPAPGGSGGDYASFMFKVNDGTDFSASANTITFNVTPANTAPTAANNTVTTTEDTDYTFSSADFDFTDTDGGDSLASVKIVTLPASGTLTLSGTAIGSGALPQTVTAAQLGNLKYSPPANLYGTGVASFTFKVNDGTVDSDNAYTMTIDVKGQNDPATGKPGITGTAQVGERLTATAGTIADLDGLPNPFISATTTVVQWIQVDGTNETDISGATSETYTLATADEGKKIKVKVSFEDDDGTAEGPLTSDAYPSSGTVTAAPVTNNAPTAANNTVTTAEDTDYTFEADDFGFADADTGATLASVKIVTLPVLGTLALNGTPVSLNDVVPSTDIGGLTFTPAPGGSGGDYASFMFKVNDGTDFSASANTITFNVTPANTAPTSADQYVEADEDTDYTFAAADFGFTDTDGGDSLASVKIVTLPASGTLTLSGTTIGSGALPQTVTAAQLGNLKYSPPANLYGTGVASFTFKVNDGTVDSDNAYTMTIDVKGQNDPATGKPGITGTAQVGERLTATAGTIADLDGLPNPFISAAATTVQWIQVDGANVTDISGATSETYTLATADEGKKIKVKVSFEDDDGTAEGPLTSDAYPSSGTVTAAPVTNNAPTAANNTVTTAEDTDYTFEADDFGFADADTGATLASVKIVTLPVLGTLALNGTAVSLNDVVPSTDIGGLTFTPAPGGSGGDYASFMFKVNDGTDFSASANTITFNVTPANTAPTSADQYVEADEDTDYTFAAADFGFTDTDGGDSLASVKIVTLPASGTLTLSGTTIGSGALPQTVTAAQLGNLKYSPPANLYGTGVASFTFKVNDGTVDSDNAYTMTIDVKGQNDPATGKPGITGTAQVGERLTATAGTIADLDGLPNPFISAAATTVQWIQVDGANVTDISGATSETYTLATADEGKKIKVKVSFEDDDGTAEGPLTSDAYPSSGTVTAAPVTNNAPTAANNTVTTAEDRPYTFEADDFGFADADTGAMLASVKIVTLPVLGTLALNGTPVSLNDVVPSTDIGGLTFTPAPGGSGGDYASFMFKVNDGTDFSASANTITFNVTPANTAPTAANNTVTTAEDTDYTFSSADFDFTDTDGGDSLASVKIVTLPASGTLTLSGTTIGSGALPQTVTAAQLGNLKYSPPANLYGTGVASFTFKVNDGTVDSDNAYTMTIDVKGQNDPATGKPGITGTAQVGERLTATAGTIADLDGLPNPFISAAATTVQWIQVDGATETDISGATSETYTLATADEGKKIMVKVSFEDDDGTAEGPLTSDAYPSSGTVTAAPVTNNAPTAANNTVTTAEDRPYTFEADDFGFADADTGAMLASVKIVTLPVLGTLALNGTPVSLNDVVPSTDIGGLTFTPAPGGSGGDYASFMFKVNDGTDFSASANTITFNVTPANTAPTAANNTVTTAEDTDYTFSSADFDFTDTDASDSLASVKIVTLPASGTLTLSGTTIGSVDLPQTVTAAQLGNLKYSPPANLYGTDVASFTFKVNDGTVDSDNAYTMTIDVKGQNDPATGKPGITGTAQVGERLTATAGTIADLDGLPNPFISAAATTVQWIQVDGANVTDISGATSETYTLATADEGKKIMVKVSFEDDDGTAEGPLTSDAYPSSGTVTAAPVTNNAPTAANNTVTTAEDTDYTFSSADFGFTDTDASDSLASVKIVTLPASGTLTLSGTTIGSGALPQTVTAAQLGNLKYSPPANLYGTDVASFTFKVNDGTVDSDNAYTMNIDVKGQNDPATGKPGITGTAQVGERLTATAGTIADLDGLPNPFISAAATTVQWIQVDGANVTDISGATSETYTLATADEGKKIKVKVSFEDDDGTAEGPLTSDAYPSSGTVTAAPVTNNAPTAANNTVTTAEDRPYTFEADDFGFADADTGATLASVKIVTLPVLGTLALNGTAVSLNDVVPSTDIGGLTFTPAPGGSGGDYASFMFKVNDGTDFSASANTITFNVTPANTAPTAANNTVTTAEDTDYTFSSADFDFTDTDAGDSLASVKIVTLPASGTGTLTLSGTAIGSGALPQTVTAAQLGNLKYSPPANLYGTGVASFTFKVNDGTVDSDNAYTMTIDVKGQNDPATGKPGITGTAQVGERLTATAGTIADLDGLPNPFISAATTVQWIQVDGTNETDISGATSETYTLATADEGKKIKVKVSFEDDDGTAEGPLTSDAYPSSGTVTAAPVTNNAPTAANNTVTTAEDTDYTFEADDFGFADADTGATLASVKIVTLPVLGTLALNGTPVSLNDVVPSTDIGGLTFTPAPGGSGGDYASFMFKVNDGTDFSASANTITFNVTPANTAPTSADQYVEADEDTDYTFAAADFGFTDTDGGDSLASVKIVTLPASGTLTLSGTTIGSGALPQTVTAAQLGNLKYSPPANLYGTGVASFTFKVNDGTVDSDNAYTMTIDVKGQNDPATGKPGITGTAQVGERLTATAGTIADLDGLPNPFISAAATTVQWIQVDGANVTDISGATSETYTLATADEGKKIKVKVSFEDDDGTAEGPLTSDAYPSSGTVTAAPVTNNAPTAANNTVTTAEDTDYTFSSADFDFTDTDASDSLASVKIVTLPASGTLTLSGTTIGSVDLPQTVTAAQLGNLKYSPPANLYGTDVASFTFKVNDGTVDSDNAYTMNIDVKGQNDPATGKPGITGTAQVGERLTATAGTIADLDGLPNPFISATTTVVQWIQVDGATETDISGATSETYTLATADEGKKIMVKVSFEDDDGTAEGPLTSDAYPSSGTVTAAPVTNNAPTAANNTVTTAEDTDYTFSSADFGFTDTDASDSLASVKIVTLPASGTLTLSGTTIGSGALPQTVTAAQLGNLKYSPPANLYGTDVASFTFKVNDGTVDSDNAYTMNIDVKGQNDPATGKPGITGTAQVGERLTATAGTIADLDRLPNPFISATTTVVQWIQVDGATVTDISGATSETYTLATADEGKKIMVKVSFEDDDGTAEGPLTSDAYPSSGTVTAAPVTNNAPTAANNTVTTAEDRPYTFEADDFGFADADTGATLASVKIVTLPVLGTLALNGTAVSLNDVVPSTDIGGLTFTPAPGGSGGDYASFMFKVNDGTDFSASANTITFNVTPANTAPTAANNTVTTAEDTDYTFSSADFDFTDTDGGDSLASVKIVTLPASGTGTLTLSGTAIGSGALPQTVTAAQLGNLKYSPPANLYGTGVASFTFKVNDGTVDSDNAYTMTIDVKGQNDPATGKPGITGTAQVGERLTATAGTIADLDGLPNPFISAATTVQWIQVDGTNETDISGATESTYTLLAADAGKKIKVKVSFEDEDGTVEGPLTSAATATVVIGVASVEIVSTPRVTSAGALSADTYGASEPIMIGVNTNGPVKVEGRPSQLPYFEFMVDGGTRRARFQGITNSDMRLLFSYTVRSTDTDTNGISWAANALALNGGTIRFKSDVPAERVDATLTHDAMGADAAHKVDGSMSDNNAATGTVTVTGTAVVGGTLTATVSGVVDSDGLSNVSYSYQWLRVDDGTATEISDAISDTYTPVGADVDKTLKVRVRFIDDLGYVEELESTATAAVDSPDTEAPVLSTATVDGASLVLTYDENLDPGSVPVAGDFAVTVDGQTAVVSNVAVNGNAVTLTLANAVAPGQTVTLGYTVPTGTNAMPLQDIAGNDAGPLTSQAVINNSLSAPGVPLNLGATPGAGRMTLTWAAPASNGGVAISKYQYRAKETGASVWDPDWTDVTDGSDSGSSAADETTVTVSGLTNGTKYRFEVRAVNTEGGGTAAARNNTPVAAPAQAPGRPRTLGAAAGNGRMTLTWAAPLSDGGEAISRYEYRHHEGSSVPSGTAWLSAGLNLRQTVTGLTNARQYTFQVRAVNSVREGPAASVQARPAATDNAPSAPRFLKAVTSDRQVGLTWFAPARDGGSSISGYQYRHAGGASVPDDTPWRSGPGYRLQAGFDSLINGQRYTFQVRAVGAVAGALASVTATPSVNPVRREPGALSGLTVTAEAYGDDYRHRHYGRVTLSLNPPAGDDNSVHERFEYRYAESGSPLPARWLQVSGDGLNETVNRLKLETDYVFEVCAVNLEGPGPAVRTTVRTPAAAVETGLISLYATQSDVAEGGALTFEVRRSSELKRGTFVLVAVTDTAFPGGNRLLGEDGLGMRVLEFQPGAKSARGTVRVAFDGARPSSRTVTVSLQSVEEPYYYGTPTTLTFKVSDHDAGLRVRAAKVREDPGAILEFPVTLDRRRDREVAVDYATSDGTATQGDDYTGVSGTLRFAPGQTLKTVSVTVLDDEHDEGSETLTLTLSNARGAAIDGDTAVGTIVNSDPLPKGWLARFGRTSATQVLGLLDSRFDEARAPASQLTLGGHSINLSGPGSNPQGREDPSGGQAVPVGGPAAPLTPGGDSRGTANFGIGPAATHADPLATSDLAGEPAVAPADPFDALASRYTLDDAARGMADLNNDPAAMHADPSAAPDPAAGAVGAGGEATLLERLAWRLLTQGGWSVDRRQFLSGSSFDLSLSALGRETDGEAIETARVRETPGHWSLWGRGALTRFAGQDTGVSLDGDVLTGLLGLDYSRGRWLAGLGLAYNDGDGAYRAPGSGTAGKLDSTLVSVHPYLHYALTDRLSAWGTLGYGAGGLRLRPERDGAPEQAAIETDIQMRMGALGLRGTVFASATTELALKSDLMWVRTASSATEGLAGVDGADASRVRLLLTGRHRHALAMGAELTPNFELGLRYDGGDAETGAGVELGGGLRYADPVRGLTVEAAARTLLAHEDGGYEEWGLSGSLQLDPGRLGRGLSLRLASGWGLTDSGTDALWQQQTASGLTQGAGQTSQGRIRAEWAYGLDVPWTHGLLTPYGSVEMAGGGRTLALGWRFELGQSLSLSLTGERREALHVTPEHALMLQTTLPW